MNRYDEGREQANEEGRESGGGGDRKLGGNNSILYCFSKKESKEMYGVYYDFIMNNPVFNDIIHSTLSNY